MHRKWYSLYDKVYLKANLNKVFIQVKRNNGAAGVDGQSIEGFGNNLEKD
ncbi:MAG TPA: hypothetical protein VJ953_10970 [Saprospiraceae bacterium]|nr:hypothetical protein [Saprospiraceae bacterium]